MIPAIHRIAQHAALYSRLRTRQLAQVLSDTLGEYSCEVDIPGRRMTFSSARGQVTITADLLASVTVAPPALVWGYSEHLAAEVGPSPVAQHIARFGALYSQPELTQDVLEYTLPDGADPAQVASALAKDAGEIGTEVFGPDSFSWTVPRGTAGAQQAFLLRAPSIEVPELTAQSVAAHLPGLMADGIDDPTWSLDGLVRLMPGWSITADQSDGSTTYSVSGPEEACAPATQV